MEWDPLLAKGDAVLEAQFLAEKLGETAGKSSSTKQAQAASITLIPFVVFCGNIALWTSAFHLWPLVVLGIQLGMLAFCILLAIVFKDSGSARYVGRLALFMCAATVASFACGFYIYYKFTIYYFSYEDLRRYTNVQASQLPTGFQDSGMLDFARTSHVDITRAVGYKSYAHGGRVFCVAPIMEQSMPLSAEIGFWAIGTDCCSARAHFECGSANDPDAHSGVILLHDDIIAPQALGWVLNLLSDRPWAEFDAALRLQNAVFGTSMAKKHILMHWERYPIKVQEDFRRDGVAASMGCCSLCLAMTFLSGVLYFKYSRGENVK